MSERQWYYISGGQQVGPVAEAELVGMFQKGQLGPDTQVWTAELQNWTKAGEVEGLISPGLLPALVTQAPSVPPIQVRPTSVTVFGIINIIWGAMGLLSAPLGVIMMFFRPRTMTLSEGVKVWLMFSSVIGLVCSVLLIILGIGLLKLKPWARVWTFGYGLFTIAWGIMGMVLSIIFISSGGYGFSPNVMPGVIGGFCGGIVGLIYPVLLVIFMRRENVIQAFNR